jgi:hypothetical protein
MCVGASLKFNAWLGMLALYPALLTAFPTHTALVWADTRELGFAASTVCGVGGSTVIFVCCDYYPAGNVQDPDLYRRNVLHP